MKSLISVVIPAYNEESGIKHFYQTLKKALPNKYNYEIIFIDDGSRDATMSVIDRIAKKDSSVKIISFSRNFGKEAATTAGILESKGAAILILDADGQHPVELIPTFIDTWEKGSQVVVGIRSENQKEGFIKKHGSKLFYHIFNALTSEKMTPGTTDFRLLDAEVREAFSLLEEKSRITRALIDWLGYKKEYIPFIANPREFGEASYSTKKLIGLAMNSFVSHSTVPLYLSGYLGVVIVPLSLLLGIFIIIEQYILGDPLQLKITGSASLGVFIVFLVGIILACQGLVALYISRVHEEVRNRPLYLINRAASTLRDK